MPKLALAVLFFLGLCQATAGLSQNAPDEAELKRLQAAIQQVQTELAATRNQRSEVARELQQSEQAILKVQQAIKELRPLIAAATSELAVLEQQASELEQQRRDQQHKISDYLLHARITSSDSSLKLLLNQDDPALGSRMLQYYQYLSQARIERVQSYRQTLASLSEVSTDIIQTTEELQAQQEKLSQEEGSLNQNHAERQSLLARLDGQLDAEGSKLANLEQERSELANLLEKLSSSVADIKLGASDVPFAKRKGQLAWPVEGKVVNAFGSKHQLGDLTWEGVTLAAAPGTDIHAIHHGRVLFADWLGSSGLLLIIDHGDGYMSLYAHNQELYKTVGDWVGSGEVISAAGNTGGQRESGLYFEIRRNGKAENPVNWCVARR